MSDATLRCVQLEPNDLSPGECTFRRTRERPGSPSHWRLVACVRDEIGADAGALVLLSVGIEPNGPAINSGDWTARRWSLTRTAPGAWQVSPSIDARDVWHHTPLIVDVPEPPPWVTP